MATDRYDWADNASRCYDLAVETLRGQYLAERFPGKTAEQWGERKSHAGFWKKTAKILRRENRITPHLNAIRDRDSRGSRAEDFLGCRGFSFVGRFTQIVTSTKPQKTVFAQFAKTL